MKKIIKKFFNYLLQDEKLMQQLLNNYSNDKFALNFSLAIYIRNKYLWNNEQLVAVMSEHYNVKHIDDISLKIIKHLNNLVRAVS